MSRSLKVVAVLAFATLAVTACGKRGVLEPPPGAEKTSTKKGSSSLFPKEHSKTKGLSSKGAVIDPADKLSSAQSTTPETEHRSFFLDGLLR